MRSTMIRKSFLTCSKVDEYEVMIDCMEQEYEEKCNEHRTEISSIKMYYEEIIKK